MDFYDTAFDGVTREAEHAYDAFVYSIVGGDNLQTLQAYDQSVDAFVIEATSVVAQYATATALFLGVPNDYPFLLGEAQRLNVELKDLIRQEYYKDRRSFIQRTVVRVKTLKKKIVLKVQEIYSKLLHFYNTTKEFVLIHSVNAGNYYKIIVEKYDSRNHPFSRVANGVKANLGQPFRIYKDAVERQAKILKKSSGGVFWDVVGGYYVGSTFPAHYFDRGFIKIVKT